MQDDDVVPLLVFIVFAGVALCMPPHNDTWWLLRSGQEMWQTGSLLSTERFSHTAYGAALYNHEWLTQLIFYSLFELGGPLLLTAFCAAAVLSALYGSWRLIRGGAEVRLSLLLVLALFTTTEWAVRPQVISFALLTVAVHLAITGRDIWLPLLCLIWANLHGMVVFGIVVAACNGVDSLLWLRNGRRGVAVAILCVVAPMLSPLGWHYWPRVLETVTISRQLDLHEYRSALELQQLPFWTIVVALLVLGFKSWPRWSSSRSDRILFLTSAVMAVAGALSVRNIPFFLVIAVPAISRLLPQPSPRRDRAAPAGVFAFVALVAAVSVAVVAYRWRDSGARLGWRPMTIAAVEAIRRCPGRLFNGFADGGPIMWFVPERRVFVDSRIEAYPLDVLLQSRSADLAGEYKATFRNYDIECAVVPSNSVMAQSLARDKEMTRAFADDQWSVFQTHSQQPH